MHHRFWLVTCLVMVEAVLVADTLVLRDGTRVQGELIGVRNGVVEFQERRGFGGGRTIRLNRDEVVRIEFDDGGPGGGPGGGQGFGRGPGFGGGRPPGMRERQVIVSADVPWNDSAIDVRAGQTVYFEATGQVRWGRDRRDGPEGERNSPPNAGRPLPNRPAAALIAKIGSSSGDVFFVGAEREGIRMRSSGRLYLGVNDDFLNDNTGNFRVVVYY